MIDLSKPWPLGIGTRWWGATVLAGLAILVLVAPLDAEVSQWARTWPVDVKQFFASITDFGQADWILWPAAVLFIATAILARFVRWRLMATVLRQFAVLYGFIFVGVGAPSLATAILKRIIGRARPEHLMHLGPFSFRPNILEWDFQSFPSGHTTTIFALAVVVAFLSPRLSWLALIFAVAVGVSRISVQAHYPTDAIAGAYMGTLGAYLIRFWFARRGWMFEIAPDGTIDSRPLSSLRRYLALKRRGSAPRRPTGPT